MSKSNKQFRMFWCKICSNLSRKGFTIIFEKNMVLVDYIGILFYMPSLQTLKSYYNKS